MDVTAEYKKRKSMLNWFLICALKGVEITDTVSAIPRDLTMQLNGVELNPVHAMKRLEEEFDRQVNDAAKEKMDDIIRDILDPFEEQVEDMTQSLKDLVHAKLPQTEE